MFSYLIKGCFRLQIWPKNGWDCWLQSWVSPSTPHSLTPTSLEHQDGASPGLWLVNRKARRPLIGCPECNLHPSPAVGSRYDPELLQKPSFKSLATFNWKKWEVDLKSVEVWEGSFNRYGNKKYTPLFLQRCLGIKDYVCYCQRSVIA